MEAPPRCFPETEMHPAAQGNRIKFKADSHELRELRENDN
jgi:hypothetical protein